MRENVRICLFGYLFVMVPAIYDTCFAFEPWIYKIIGMPLLRRPDHPPYDFVNSELMQLINTQHIFFINSIYIISLSGNYIQLSYFHYIIPN